MKNIILSATVALAIFASTGAFARGFSVGVLGSYAIDNGAIDDSVNEQKGPFGIASSTTTKNEPIEIAGAALFVQYDFKNSIFLRTGFESNFTINSAQMVQDDVNYYDYTFEYSSYTLPFYLGISLSPDRGRTSIYGAAGAFYSNIEITRKTNQLGVKYKIDSDTDLFGFGGLFGIERILFNRVFLVIEYAFYAGTKSKSISDDDGYTGSKYNHYSLPTQQMRLGFKYGF